MQGLALAAINVSEKITRLRVNADRWMNGRTEIQTMSYPAMSRCDNKL